jgi:hypothetical protein
MGGDSQESQAKSEAEKAAEEQIQKEAGPEYKEQWGPENPLEQGYFGVNYPGLWDAEGPGTIGHIGPSPFEKNLARGITTGLSLALTPAAGLPPTTTFLENKMAEGRMKGWAAPNVSFEGSDTKQDIIEQQEALRKGIRVQSGESPTSLTTKLSTPDYMIGKKDGKSKTLLTAPFGLLNPAVVKRPTLLGG